MITMESVRGVNVPMYTTLRRTTVVFTMLMEYILAGQRYTSSVVFSVGLIVFGAFIAGARGLSFDAYGYAIVFLSNISTAIYLATIARIGKINGLNSFGLMWCNGIICGPVLLIWTLIRGDMKMAINFPYLFSPGFITHFPVHELHQIGLGLHGYCPTLGFVKGTLIQLLGYLILFQVGKAHKKYKVVYPTLYALESKNKDAQLFNYIHVSFNGISETIFLGGFVIL
ncbi:hypothetical protein K1719_032830 [Acacia pycnantha]|nr:hypothetical protein K1719_032830 [Acacia pycnantha]